MNREEDATSVGMIALIDTLACALAAILMLYMAQANTPTPSKQHGVGQASFTVQLNPTTPLPHPTLALRFQMKGLILTPAEVKKEYSSLVFDSTKDGEASYTLLFRARAEFPEADRLLIFLHDAQCNPLQPPVSIQARLLPSTSSDISPGKEFALSLEHPLLSIPLSDLSGQRQNAKPRWELP